MCLLAPPECLEEVELLMARPGMQTASRYFPATQGAGVGGDWFDLIPLGAGRIGVLIGDVMGRGLEAATVMGQLRSAANALARTGMPPQQLMDALDLVARDIPDQLTTCCYLVIDADAGEMSACSAGHLPVLLVDPDGAVHRLPIPVSVPLGVGGIPHEQTTMPVAPRATLVLYTDGLVETHRCDIDKQIAALEDELRTVFTPGPGLEQAADQILAALLPHIDQPPDDVTLLLARIPAAPLSSAATTMEPEPQAVAAARRWVSMRLIITEITDDSTHLPQRRLPGPEDESGRGLMLVQALASSWGTRPAETGKTVWFTLALDPVREPDPDGMPAPRSAQSERPDRDLGGSGEQLLDLRVEAAERDRRACHVE